jgi:hypothetical protein
MFPQVAKKRQQTKGDYLSGENPIRIAPDELSAKQNDPLGGFPRGSLSGAG